MQRLATHPGKVIKVEHDRVTVEMHVLSACSSCKAHEKCAFVDKADKTVEIETSEWQHFAVGDSVTVSVNEGLGLFAVLLAYILPALVIIASVVTITITTHSEALAAIIPIALTVIYFLILYKLHDRLQTKFSFGIMKND